MAIQRAKYTPKIKNQLIINGERLPYAYSLESVADLTIRAKAEKRGYSHGSTITGDGYIDGKKIKLGFLISGKTQDDYDYKLNELLRIFYQRNYTLSTGPDNGFYNVACMASSKAKWVKGYQGLRAEVDITLLLADPFRYAETEITGNVTLSQNKGKLEIINNGSVDVPLSIELIPTESMADVTVKHVESGRAMRIADTLLTAPATLIVDTKAGTVRRGTFNAINAFSGQFLTAKPGRNNYEISGSDGKVIFKWRNRWLA